MALDGKRGWEKICKGEYGRGRDYTRTMQKGIDGSRSARKAVREHITSFPTPLSPP